MTDKQILELARQRAFEILEAWWMVTPDIWEYQEEQELSDEELKKVLDVSFDELLK